MTQVTWRVHETGTLSARQTEKGRNCEKTMATRIGLTALETPSSEERWLMTMRHINRALVVAELRRHANEIVIGNQTADRTRPEVVPSRPLRSGRVIATGAVQTLHLYHASPPSGSVSDSANAR